jgi:hypothetical protein
MRAVAVFAAMVFLLGAAPAATRGVTEIVVTECTFGYELPGGPGLRSFKLTRDGTAVRAITPPGDPERAPGADRTRELTQIAHVGGVAFRTLAQRFERSAFFTPSTSSVGIVTTDTRGALVSVVHDGRRTTWSQAHRPGDRDQTLFYTLRDAVYDVVDDKSVVWRTVPPRPDLRAICEARSER